MVDLKDQFKSASCKWQKIVDAMNASGHLSLPRNNATCKDKWGVIYKNFKRTLTTWLQQETTKVLRFDLVKEDALECVLPLQQSTQTQEKLQKKQINYFKSKESEQTNYFKFKDVEINI